jgi:hypothetical protein
VAVQLQKLQQAGVVLLLVAIGQATKVEEQIILTIHVQQAVMLRNTKALIFLQEVKHRRELQAVE